LKEGTGGKKEEANQAEAWKETRKMGRKSHQLWIVPKLTTAL
jgi:hypothetical protein